MMMRDATLSLVVTDVQLRGSGEKANVVIQHPRIGRQYLVPLPLICKQRITLINTHLKHYLEHMLYASVECVVKCVCVCVWFVT